MILSGGGYSLPVAFEMSLDYLPTGVVKEEFTKIVSDLHTGQTMEMALNSFAERVPSEGIKSFVKALNNANKLSVSVVDILRARAFASRKDLETEIEKRVTGLPVKVMLILSPSSAAAIIIIAISPSISAIMNML
jgi:pilus assembly protein TadC